MLFFGTECDWAAVGEAFVSLDGLSMCLGGVESWNDVVVSGPLRDMGEFGGCIRRNSPESLTIGGIVRGGVGLLWASFFRVG
jgi:hypothetical protein